jgi:UDP-N-acetylglucosamine transferase subunit ALG13
MNSLIVKSMSKNQKINIALVCIAGGHFEQMTNLSDFYNSYDHFWITNRTKQTESQLEKERAYHIEIAHFKKPWTYLYQIAPVLKIFLREKPTHVLSTGSGKIAFIPFQLAWLLNVNFIYIDTFSRVHGHSKFGTFLLETRNKIYTQWEDSQNRNAIYIGPIFKQKECLKKTNGSKYIFVTVGSRGEPFLRLLNAVEGLIKKGTIKEKVIIQAGHTKYRSNFAEVFDFCLPKEMDEFILSARYVITQESAGVGTLCLKYRTKFIVMPRDYQYGELNTKSDMKEDLHWKLEELGYTRVVRNIDELEKAILNIEDLKVGFNFDNSLAIQTLKKIIEIGNSSQ